MKAIRVTVDPPIRSNIRPNVGTDSPVNMRAAIITVRNTILHILNSKDKYILDILKY